MRMANCNFRYWFKEAGFTLLEMIVVCGVSVSLIGLGATQVKHRLHRQSNQSIAYHLRLITDAAKSYVKDHYEILSASATQGFESKFSVEDLKAFGYLPSTVRSVNALGQTYSIQIAATEAKEENIQLSVLVLSHGGSAAEQADLQAIAGLAGGDAGYVDQRSDGHVLSGLGGSWSIQNLADMSYGHFGSLNFVRAHEILDAKNFLMRKQIPNCTSYNEMETNLGLSRHEIHGENGKASYVISATSGILLCTEGGERATLEGNSLLFESSAAISNLSSEKLTFDNSNTKTSLSEQLSIETPAAKLALSAEAIQLNKDQEIYATLLAENGLSVGNKTLFSEQSDLFYDRRTAIEANGAHIRFPFYELPYSKEKEGVIINDQIDTTIDGLLKKAVQTVCEFAHPGGESGRIARIGRAFLVGYNSQGTPGGVRAKALVVCTYGGAFLLPAVSFYDF